MKYQILGMTFFAFLACWPLPVQADLILSVDYENGSFGGAETCSGSTCPSGIPSMGFVSSRTIVNSPVKSGTGAVHIKLSSSDLSAGCYLYGGFNSVCTRAEFEKWNIATAEGQERWVGFAMYVPSTYKDSQTSNPGGVTVFQWHEQNWDSCDTGSGFYKSPPLLMMIRSSDKHFLIRQETDSRGATQCQDQNYVNRIDWDAGPVTYNQWNDFVIHIKIAADNTGILQIWRNGSQIVNQSNHPTVYRNASSGTFIKWGVYNSWWGSHTPSGSDLLETYVDDLKVGDHNSSYAEVAPVGSTFLLAPPTNLTVQTH